MTNKFTQKEIEILRSNPNVKDVKENRLTVTYEFRLRMYESSIVEPGVASIRSVLNENGFDSHMVGWRWINHQNQKFKLNGKPSRGKNRIIGEGYCTAKADKDYEEFINELYRGYPHVSVEEQLLRYNIDPQKVGYQRIYQLKQKIESKEKRKKTKIYNDTFIEKYNTHPYVFRCTRKQFVLSNW